MYIKIAASKSSLSKRKLVCGVGINDADYITKRIINGKNVRCKVYARWVNMLRRAYCKKFQEKHPTYIGTTICTQWLRFSVFSAWDKDNMVEGFDLDKDLKVKGNKHYSPDTCLYLPRCINTLLIDCGASRGRLPIGVDIHKTTGKFRAQIRVDSKRIHLGLFKTVNEAMAAYRKAKNEEIVRKSIQYPNLSKYLLEYKEK